MRQSVIYKRKSKLSKILLSCILLIVALFGVLTFKAKEVKYPKSIRLILTKFWPSADRGVLSLKKTIDQKLQTYWSNTEYADRYFALNEKHQKLRLQSTILESENLKLTSLKELMLFKNKNSKLQWEFAEVGFSSSSVLADRIHAFTKAKLNVGESKGVINRDGVVGYTYNSDNGQTDILSVIHHEFSASIMNERTFHRGIWKGSGELESSLNFEKVSNIRIGDLLVTTGSQGTFPKNFPIGYISHLEFSTSGLATIIKAKPIVSADTLNFVLIYQSKKKTYAKNNRN